MITSCTLRPFARPRILLAAGLLAALAWLAACPAVLAGETVFWGRVPSAPFYYMNPDGSQAGFAYDVEMLLRERLPEYRHEGKTLNLTRLFANMRHGETWCATYLIRTPEREAFMTFSRPSMILFPNAVIARSDDPRFMGKSSVSLHDLLADHSLIMGIATDRSYGPTIDALAATAASRNVQVSHAPDIMHELLRMLLAKRFDFCIGFPMEAGYVARTLGVSERIHTLPITEIAGESIVASVACSRTPLGETLIPKINAILAEELPTERYMGFFTPYVEPDRLPEFRRTFSDSLLPR